MAIHLLKRFTESTESMLDSAILHKANSKIVDEFLGLCEASDNDRTLSPSRKRAEALPKKSPQAEFALDSAKSYHFQTPSKIKMPANHPVIMPSINAKNAGNLPRFLPSAHSTNPLNQRTAHAHQISAPKAFWKPK